MTSSWFNQLEQSELKSTPIAPLSKLQFESFDQIPSNRYTAEPEPLDLTVGNIWAELQQQRKDICRPGQQQHPIQREAPIIDDIPDDPNRDTFLKLSFGIPGKDSPFSSAEEAQKITSDAERGKEHADSQESIWRWGRPLDNGKIAPPKDGDDPTKYTHVNSDQSSYTVTNGRISEFQTAPTKDQPNGVKYSDIEYDSEGLIRSYKNSFGQMYSKTNRTPEYEESKGLSMWMRTDTETGVPADYGNFRAWNVSVDTDGIHIMTSDGTMFSRESDGSQVLTHLIYNGPSKATGFETITTLPDNTKVSRQGTFNNAHKLEHADTVDVKEADGKYYTNIPVGN